MPRHARIVIPGVAHHITQRGNHRQAMFYCPEDRMYFLELLGFYAAKSKLEVMSYSLMTNHVHLIAVPRREDSLANALKPVHMCYSQRLNKVGGKIGINWQGRFFSSPMDEVYTWHALKYIMLNPVTAKIESRFENYPWSSARAHLGLETNPYLNANREWLEIAAAAVRELREELKEGNSFKCQAQFDEIIKLTNSNLPIGSETFIDRLEKIAGRRLTLGKPGRRTIRSVGEAAGASDGNIG